MSQKKKSSPFTAFLILVTSAAIAWVLISPDIDYEFLSPGQQQSAFLNYSSSRTVAIRRARRIPLLRCVHRLLTKFIRVTPAPQFAKCQCTPDGLLCIRRNKLLAFPPDPYLIARFDDGPPRA